MNKIIKILDYISNTGIDWSRWALCIFLLVFVFMETGIATLILAIVVIIDREIKYYIAKEKGKIKNEPK